MQSAIAILGLRQFYEGKMKDWTTRVTTLWLLLFRSDRVSEVHRPPSLPRRSIRLSAQYRQVFYAIRGCLYF